MSTIYVQDSIDSIYKFKESRESTILFRAHIKFERLNSQYRIPCIFHKILSQIVESIFDYWVPQIVCELLTYIIAWTEECVKRLKFLLFTTIWCTQQSSIHFFNGLKYDLMNWQQMFYRLKKFMLGFKGFLYRL